MASRLLTYNGVTRRDASECSSTPQIMLLSKLMPSQRRTAPAGLAKPIPARWQLCENMPLRLVADWNFSVRTLGGLFQSRRLIRSARIVQFLAKFTDTPENVNRVNL